MNLLQVVLFASIGSLTATASNVNTFPKDPYNSAGSFENVRNIAVDPTAAAKVLQPAAPPNPSGPPPAAGATGQLTIHNETFTWANLYVNGLRVGDVESLDTVTLAGLKPGIYQVILVLPNGYRMAWDMSTDPDVAPKPIIPAPQVKPAPSAPATPSEN